MNAWNEPSSINDIMPALGGASRGAGASRGQVALNVGDAGGEEDSGRDVGDGSSGEEG